MTDKIKSAPLCRGAELIARITLPMILLEIAFIFFFTRGMSAYELTAHIDVVMKMIEDTMSSIALSLGGVLLFDLFFKKNAGGG